MTVKLKSGETMRLYRDLAWLWPIISPPETYQEEGQCIIENIRRYQKIKTTTLLNLGSGGGHVDSVLKKEFKITGVDISPQIMSLAQKLNPEVEYKLDDMRTARMERQFDAVLLHDAITHMETLEELRAAFLTGYVHLKQGGLLLTFVEEWPEHFVQNRTEVRHFRKDGLEVTYIENNYDPDPSDGTYECTFVYLIRREGYLDIQTDRLIMNLFPVSDWVDTMEEVGFNVHLTQMVLSKSPDVEPGGTLSYPMLIGIKE